MVAGPVTISGTSDFGVARYNSDGTLDTTFGTDGEATANFGPDLTVFLTTVVTNGTGPGNGTAALPLPIPNDPIIISGVFPVQWGVLDSAAPGVLPVALSAGGKIVIY